MEKSSIIKKSPMAFFTDKNGKPVGINTDMIMAIEYIKDSSQMWIRFNCMGDQVKKYNIEEEDYFRVTETLL